MRSSNPWIAALLALAAILTVHGGTAQAQVLKPFKIVGQGFGPQGLPLPGQPARPHWIVGTATHLGKHTGAGTVKVDAITGFDPATGIITGAFGSGDPFVFVAADGSRLGFYYGRVDKGAKQPGVFTLTSVGPGVYVPQFYAEFVVAPETCTGRFVGTSGSFFMLAVGGPTVPGATDPLPYGWQGQGQLLFPR